MNAAVTSGFARPLACMELTDRFEAPQRLAKFANIDDLHDLDALCLKGRDLVHQQQIGSANTLCQEMIRDLTICLGEIIRRYVRSDWSIGVEPMGEGEYTDPAWILVLYAQGDCRSLQLESYVEQRFFQRTETPFAQLVDDVVVMAKSVPGLYIGGYETPNSSD